MKREVISQRSRLHRLWGRRAKTTLCALAAVFAFGVIAGSQEVLRSSSYNYAIPRSRGLFDHALGDSDNAVGVKGLNWHARATLITSKSERLEQTVIKRVAPLLMFLNYGLLTVCEAGDLLCEKLIPEFPTQLGSKIFGDLSRARSIFSLDRDDSDHHSSKCLDAVADKVEG